jgi:hypothetical protein
MTPRLISWLTLLQLLVILFGVSATGLLVKAFNITAGGAASAPFLHTVRNYGFWLASASLIWALVATLTSGSRCNSTSTGTAIAAARWILLLLLCLGFAAALFVAFSQLTYGGPKPTG